MAEIHIIGQICQAKGFPKNRLFCRWHLQVGNNWKHIEGKKEGQTQVSWSDFDNICQWSFPIDIHLATTGIQGWPKIYIEVYHFDWLGRGHIFGYGIVTIPTSPGTYTLDCYTWRPFGSIRQRFFQYFLGGGLQLKNPDQVFSAGERYKLSTEAMGVKMSALLILAFVVTTLTKGNANTDVSTSTEATSISTVSLIDSTYIFENETIENSTFEFSTETTSLSPFHNDTLSKKVINNKKLAVPDQEYCTCDLQMIDCDLNCCCDQACSTEDKEVFQYCKIEPDLYYDSRYCDYTKYIFINNTRFQWKINQNGLFCIVKSNKPPSYTLQRKHPLKTLGEANRERLKKFSWPTYDSTIIKSFNSSKKLIYGSDVWYVDKGGLKTFEIPNTFLTNRCIIKESVYYLKNTQTACSQIDVNEGNAQLNLKYHIENIKFVADPNLLNTTKIEENFFEGCPKNVCLAITSRICDQSFTTCIDFPKSDSRVTVKCNLSIKDKRNVCINIVKKLQYNFYHNGTQGITSILLLASLENVSYEFGVNAPEIKQEYFVNFYWRNTSMNISTSLSGNPGYLYGKPLLLGKLSTTVIKNGTYTLSKIERNSSEYSKNFLTISKNINGDCIFTSTEYLTVEFGYNLLTRCNFRKTLKINKKVTNGTEICRALQNSILQHWDIDDFKMIGSFGNTNAANLNDWIKVLHQVPPPTVLNNTLGLYHVKSNSVFCKNIATVLNIDIFYSRIDVGSLINQKKVLAVTYSFGGYCNQSLDLTKTGNYYSLFFNIDLEAHVAFFDITAEKIKKVVDPPSLKITLPYDFFYPFVRINNNGCSFERNYFNLFSVVTLSIFVLLINPNFE